MRKRVWIWICLLILACFFIGGAVFFAVQARKSCPELDGANVFQGKTIQITQEQIDEILDQYKFTGAQKTASDAVNFLIQYEAAFQLASAEGISVTDKELTEKLEETKQLFREADNLRDFENYLNAEGLTFDEYFEKNRNRYRKELAVGKYNQKILEQHPEFMKDQEAYQKYLEDAINDYIAADHVCTDSEIKTRYPVRYVKNRK